MTATDLYFSSQEPASNTSSMVVEPTSGQPQSPSNSSKLNVGLTGSTGVKYYKHKIGPSNQTRCSAADNYGGIRSLTLPLDNDLSHLPDGLLTLCILGCESETVCLEPRSAKVIQWNKDTLAPQVTKVGGVAENSINGIYFTGQTIFIAVSFSEPVLVKG